MISRRAFAESEHRRRAARGRRRRQAVIGLAAVAVTTLTVVAVGMDKLLRPGAFPIKELRLEGEFNHLDPVVVQQAILQELGNNYFSLDLSRIEQAVENLPWAREAKVRRSWPHGLRVWIREQHPVARWDNDRWLNDEAQVFELKEEIDSRDMVSLKGPSDRARYIWRRYNEWAPLLSGIGLDIDSIQVDDRFSWTLNVNSVGSAQTIRVLLGIDNHDQRIRRFVDSYHQLSQQTDSLIAMDLRYPNGFAITQGSDAIEDKVALNEVDQ